MGRVSRPAKDLSKGAHPLWEGPPGHASRPVSEANQPPVLTGGHNQHPKKKCKTMRTRFALIFLIIELANYLPLTPAAYWANQGTFLKQAGGSEATYNLVRDATDSSQAMHSSLALTDPSGIDRKRWLPTPTPTCKRRSTGTPASTYRQFRTEWQFVWRHLRSVQPTVLAK